MKISNFKISSKSPFYVAEISGNHAGKYKLLEKTILAAVNSGASAVKIQSYSPDDMTINSNKKDFLIKGINNKWNNKNLYDLYKEGQTPSSWLKKLFKFCAKRKIICFASPFSINSVIELERFNCPAYKIASLEINNIPLLKAIAKTNKPVIISTGGAKLNEIKNVIKFFKNNKNLALLKCTVNYPANFDELNLNTIKDLKRRFKSIEVGFSDHTIGDLAAITAVSFGASIIEKHFTLNKKINSIDDFFSSDPKEMKNLIERCNQSILSAGAVSYGPTRSEKKSIKYRRSIYVCKKILKGEKITEFNVRLARPAGSLNSKYYYKILGRKSKKKLDIGSRISLKFLK